MNRNLEELTSRDFDVLIVGGGIFGAAAVWDATQRGLSVALIEKDDFGGATSANSYKMIHGGIRYLQHGDIPRLRASCFERSALLRIAPHLVRPLPILIPTYGFGREGKAFLGSGMYLYDLLTIDRNLGIRDRQRKIPWSKLMSRQETLDLFPDLVTEDLTGGAVFCDGQMYNPTRLVLSFLRSATENGAIIANYVRATRFLLNNNRVKGVEAQDCESKESITIRARVTLNAAGPWAEHLLQKEQQCKSVQPGTYSRDACFLIPRKFANPIALAVQGRTRDPDALLSRSARHLFLVPWREWTLVGVWHVVYTDVPDKIKVTENDLQAFINEINWAYRGLDIKLDEVTMWNAGLVPFGENQTGSENLSYGKRSRIINHKREHNIDGLVTLIGIRYTMARADAARAIDLVCAQLEKPNKRPATHRIPIYGGDIKDFDELEKEVYSRIGSELGDRSVCALAHNYGSAYKDVLNEANQDSSLVKTLGDSSVLKAEVVHSIRNEMVVRLSDIIFRRTELGTGGDPGKNAIQECADLAATHLKWDKKKTKQEIAEVTDHFPIFNKLN